MGRLPAGIIPVGANAAMAIPEFTDTLTLRQCNTGSYTKKGAGGRKRDRSTRTATRAGNELRGVSVVHRYRRPLSSTGCGVLSDWESRGGNTLKRGLHTGEIRGGEVSNARLPHRHKTRKCIIKTIKCIVGLPVMGYSLLWTVNRLIQPSRCALGSSLRYARTRWRAG